MYYVFVHVRSYFSAHVMILYMYVTGRYDHYVNMCSGDKSPAAIR